jgi:hypothetical protein
MYPVSVVGRAIQLHEDLENLRKISNNYEEEITVLENNGIKTIRIDTDNISLEEVTEEIRRTIGPYI